MSDLLAHYAVSYLVASRVLKPRHALLVALVGLLLRDRRQRPGDAEKGEPTPAPGASRARPPWTAAR